MWAGSGRQHGAGGFASVEDSGPQLPDALSGFSYDPMTRVQGPWSISSYVPSWSLVTSLSPSPPRFESWEGPAGPRLRLPPRARPPSSSRGWGPVWRAGCGWRWEEGHPECAEQLPFNPEKNAGNKQHWWSFLPHSKLTLLIPADRCYTLTRHRYFLDCCPGALACRIITRMFSGQN